MEDIKIHKLKEVIDLTGIKTSTIYKLIARGDFPKQIKLTNRSVGWSSKDIEAWIQSRISNIGTGV